MADVELFDKSYAEAVDVGSGVVILFYLDVSPDMVHRQTSVRVKHTCKTVGDNRLIVAPLLDERHGWVKMGTNVTINPSISCPDCGLHGFVRDGKWSACA